MSIYIYIYKSYNSLGTTDLWIDAYEILCFQNGFASESSPPQPDVLYSVCSHAVFNLRSTRGCIHHLSWGVNGLSLDRYPTDNGDKFFGSVGAYRFCKSLGMVGCVAKGVKLRQKVRFQRVYGAALAHASGVSFKAGRYKLGTNCVAFTLYMSGMCDSY